MRTEVLVLRRCCFCLPLRYGLLVWGYLKLIITMILMVYLFAIVYVSIIFLGLAKVYVDIDLLIHAVALLIVTGDFILHIVFVVGAHSKEIKLLRVYYIYSPIMAVFSFLMIIICAGIIIHRMFIENSNPIAGAFVTASSGFFINLLFQVYITLLVRSEIIKLKNAMSFKFVNNAAEAECTLIIEDTCAEKTSNIDKVKKVDEVVKCN